MADYPKSECVVTIRNTPGFYANRANQDDLDPYLGVNAEFDYNAWGLGVVDQPTTRSTGNVDVFGSGQDANYAVVSQAGYKREA